MTGASMERAHRFGVMLSEAVRDLPGVDPGDRLAPDSLPHGWRASMTLLAVHPQVLAFVRERGMVTMVTPFDEVSVDKCVEFGVDILKMSTEELRSVRGRERVSSPSCPGLV